MNPTQITFTPTDWTRGTQTLQEIDAGLLVQTQADLFRASLLLIERAERILAIGIAWAAFREGRIEGVPPTIVDFVQQQNVSGNLKAARSLTLITTYREDGTGSVPAAVPYAATLHAVRALLHGTTRAGSGEGLSDLGIAPAVAVLIGVVGIAAIAGGTWWGVEHEQQKVKIANHAATLAAEVERYTRELEIRIAAGAPLPDPPQLIERMAAAEQASPYVLTGLGAVGGALVAFGAYKGFSSPTTVRQNPRPRLGARGRLLVDEGNPAEAPKKKAAPKKNPLTGGYSRATIGANVTQLRREGYPAGIAAAIALKMARVEWRRKHPAGAFPKHLETVAEREGHRRPKKSRSAKTNPRASASSARSRGRSSAKASASPSAAKKRRKKPAKRSSPKRASARRPAKRPAKRTAKRRAPKRATR